MRIWNRPIDGTLAHPFELVEPGHERRVCGCKTAEWRWQDADHPSDKDKCRGGLLLERDEARYKAEQNRLKANLADQMRDAAILWKQRACDLGWVDPEPPPLPIEE